MGRALLLLLLFPFLSVLVFGKSNSDERSVLIGSGAPAGKLYVYKHSSGEPREMEVFFPMNHDPAKSRRLVVGGGSADANISAIATLNHALNNPADPQSVDIRPMAYLQFNPAFSPDDANDPQIDERLHLAGDMPPSLVFFGDKDPWKNAWDAVHAKMSSQGIGSVELQIALWQDHGFFNTDPQQSVTLIATDRFLARFGLLTGEPTKTMPASGEKLLASWDAAQSLAAPKNKATSIEKISIAGNPVTIKVPDQPAPGKPWLWVGEFPGQLKAFQDGLIEKGWHVVYVGVSNQFGSPRTSDKDECLWVWCKTSPRLNLCQSCKSATQKTAMSTPMDGKLITTW